jgi:putative cell wall-binding protein
MSSSPRNLKFVALLAVVAVGLLGFAAPDAGAATLPPTTTTNAATGIASTSATLNGTVNPNGTTTTYSFQYGTTASYGLTTAALSAGSGTGAFSVSALVTGLAANTTYYFQLVATNSNGTTFGGQLSFVASSTTTVVANRVSGADRYKTSASIAETKYPSGVSSGNVVLATGTGFADALAGNYLAGQLGAPILLTPPAASDPAFATTTAALGALAATHVYILGGTSAVGADVELALSAGRTVTRIGGATRYDTMQMIDTAAGLTPGAGATGSRTAIVANGGNFPDALAAGPLAWADKLPIVLTDGTQNALSAQATAVISADAITHFIVLGGSAAIVATQVTQLSTLGTVDQQFAGADRTDTAAQFAAYTRSTYAFTDASVILAAGQDYPDALSAGAWGGDTQNIYLTESADSIGSYTTGAFESVVGAVDTLNIVGGLNAIDDNAATTAQDALQGTSGVGSPATTTAASNVTTSSATLNGTVDPQGSPTTYYFQYGTTTSYGLNTVVQSAGSGTTAIAVSTSVTGLLANTTYYFQLVATNAAGTTFGGQLTFFTGNSSAPLVTTTAATNVTSTTATLNGTVNPEGLATTYYFQYGTTTSYGLTTTTLSAGAGTSDIPVSASVSGLTTATTYYFQLVANNTSGTAFGAQQTLFTEDAPTVTSVSPTGGTSAGGTTVTIHGTNFIGATTVNFGPGNPGIIVTVNSATKVTVTAPPGTGTVDVTVTTPTGSSAITASDHYTYS